MRPARYPLAMAVHPTTRGFGWVAFEGPMSPYDWGTVCIKGRDKNGQCLRAVEKLMNRLEPQTLSLEAFDADTSQRANRITRLGLAIKALAEARGVEVSIYSRTDIQACFAVVGAKTRREIAEAVCRSADALSHRLPAPRRLWESESGCMGLFSAAALVFTHYRQGALSVLREKGKPSL